MSQGEGGGGHVSEAAGRDEGEARGRNEGEMRAALKASHLKVSSWSHRHNVRKEVR